MAIPVFGPPPKFESRGKPDATIPGFRDPPPDAKAALRVIFKAGKSRTGEVILKAGKSRTGGGFIPPTSTDYPDLLRRWRGVPGLGTTRR